MIENMSVKNCYFYCMAGAKGLIAGDAVLGKMQSVGDRDVRPHALNKKDHIDTCTREVQHHW